MQQPDIKPTVIVPDTETVWSRIIRAAPTANPTSARTFIHPVKP
jgi:hypothetical protein